MITTNNIAIVYLFSFLCITLFSLLILLHVFLIYRKKRDHVKSMQRNKIKEILKPSIFNYFFREDLLIDMPSFQEVGNLFYEALEEIIAEYEDVLKGEDVQEKITKFAEHYFTSFYLKRLRHKRYSVRMNTLYRIEDFQMKSLEEQVIERYFETERIDLSEYYQALRTLATLQSSYLRQKLFTASFELPVDRYKECIRRYVDGDFKIFVESMPILNQAFKRAVLEIIGEKRNPTFYVAAEEQLSSPDVEIRLAALKVILSFGYISNFEQLESFSTSIFWQERMLFSKICGNVKRDRFKLHLTKLIGDSNWFVRNAAGEALSKYTEGKLILEHIYKTSDDRFAKDMALQWLSGGNV